MITGTQLLIDDDDDGAFHNIGEGGREAHRSSLIVSYHTYSHQLASRTPPSLLASLIVSLPSSLFLSD